MKISMNNFILFLLSSVLSFTFLMIFHISDFFYFFILNLIIFTFLVKKIKKHFSFIKISSWYLVFNYLCGLVCILFTLSLRKVSQVQNFFISLGKAPIIHNLYTSYQYGDSGEIWHYFFMYLIINTVSLFVVLLVYFFLKLIKNKRPTNNL